MFSSHPRPSRYRVAILGFNGFERAALASFFRLAERRVPGYVQVESDDDDSDFIVADADEPRVLARINREQRIADTVFIGEQAPDDALAWLTRPIEPIHIMRALDALLGSRRGVEQAEPAAPALPRKREPLARPAPPASVRAAKAPTATPTPAAARPGADRRVLVADAREPDRSALQQRLIDLGYRVSAVASGDEALESADWTAFDIAFVDLNLRHTAGPDGLGVCQALKANRGQAQRPAATAVVITTDDGNATDKVRGVLAGCDAYLVKPLLEPALTAALEKVDPAFTRL